MFEARVDHRLHKHPDRAPNGSHLAAKDVAAALALTDLKGDGTNRDHADGAVARLHDTIHAHALCESPEPTQKRQLHPAREGDDFS